ncbi:MAG: NTP transferase domain-containing protein [Actinomycetota bacterium]|nr:NTP transferase domain-containing protein [Actinomycetota bacterium]
MAAGLGSRFGGTKQLATVGPDGEAIFDYTIRDARRSGFGRIVMIVRSEIRDEVVDHVTRIHGTAIDLTTVCQDHHGPPRAKPWGTAHAVLAAADVVAEPFAVANADDLYGPETFDGLAAAFADDDRDRGGYHLMAFELERTLSPRGSVSRGVCEVAADGTLANVTEHLAIERRDDGTIADADGSVFAADALVSMNLWGLQPDLFEHLAPRFERFVADHAEDAKAEFLLPVEIASVVEAGAASVRVHRTTADWYGVTYPGDLEDVRAYVADGRVEA